MSETMRPALQSMGMDEWTAWVQREGEPAYRATQIFSWVHEKQVTDYAEMTNISMGLKVALSRDFESEPLSLVKRQTSSDGTNKFLFELADGAHIESVFMPYHHGNSVCISTQVGCSMDCVFCASTLDGILRNLSRGEMLAQVYEIQRIMGERVSHVVMMGMGEPLDNIIECTAFIRMINDPRGQGMSMRHHAIHLRHHTGYQAARGRGIADHAGDLAPRADTGQARADHADRPPLPAG